MSKIRTSKGKYVAPEKVQSKDDNMTEYFSIEKPTKDLDKIILSKKSRQEILSLLSKIKNHDLLYNKFGLKEIDPTGGRTAINLYGPPGTGKSVTAEAIANYLGKNILRANYSEIESKFVGETPKNIRAIFQKAKDTDSVLIFDEADSLLSTRLSIVNQSTDHAVNVTKSVLLLELDNFSGTVIFTTNFGKNYDSAFVRRILGHIELSLPDLSSRKAIFESFLPENLPVMLSIEEKENIINKMEGFSGGDILNVVLFASSQAVERDGENCLVLNSDFMNSVQLIKRAKEVIGKEV